MIANYNFNDIEDWAAYSGDRNEIHFNDKKAQEAGLSGVVVHGMLAMLPLKNNQNMESSFYNSGWKWKINLKKPVPMEESVEYLFDESQKSTINFRLINQKSREVLYQGTSYYCEFNPDLEHNDGRINVSKEELDEKSYHFLSLYPKANKYWAFLDSLVFREYILSNNKTPLARETKEFLEKHELIGNNNFVVYQVSHIVDVRSDFVNKKIPDVADDVFFTTTGKDLMQVGENIHGAVEYNVYVNQKIVMSVYMGLMVIFNKGEEDNV